MRIFKTKYFSGWAKQLKLEDESLIELVKELEQGLHDAHLGIGLYKKRVAIGGRGKREGARTIIAFKAHDKAIFLYGFAKAKRENISLEEKDTYKRLTKYYLNATERQIDFLIKDEELIEVLL